jgi:hypothetical protein
MRVCTNQEVTEEQNTKSNQKANKMLD